MLEQRALGKMNAPCADYRFLMCKTREPWSYSCKQGPFDTGSGVEVNP